MSTNPWAKDGVMKITEVFHARGVMCLGRFVSGVVTGVSIWTSLLGCRISGISPSHSM